MRKIGDRVSMAAFALIGGGTFIGLLFTSVAKKAGLTGVPHANSNSNSNNTSSSSSTHGSDKDNKEFQKRLKALEKL